MKKYIYITVIIAMGFIFTKEAIIMVDKKTNNLTEKEKSVIIDKGTEAPFTGKYYNFFEQGTYICKKCDAPLYRSNHKFESSCGWPSFDDEIKGAVKRIRDADGTRTEIICTNCGGHLGHVFTGEQLTGKNLRHCVNSISMKFIPNKKKIPFSKAYFAGGCFWGVEYHFEKKEGVISAVSGYMGGDLKNPTYEDVIHKDTGHFEAVEITYDTDKISYEELTKLFFEIHDPTQKNGQGPDIGGQYLSALFYNNDKEKSIATKLINILKKKGYGVVTQLMPAEKFWKAEEYHQNYYKKTRKEPYCHIYKKKF